MAGRALVYSYKPPVAVYVGDVSTDSLSGCKIIEITFPNVVAPEIEEIYFQNYYTAFLTVRVKFRGIHSNGGSGESKWKTCLQSFQLMPDPHTETGSQDYFTIKKNQFLFELVDIAAMTLILQQPSPVWKEFRIDDIKLYKPSQVSSSPLPPWLTGNQKKEKKQLKGAAPNIDTVSSTLQQMWALSEHATAIQTRTALGRYEVDSCYEINLLSYT